MSLELKTYGNNNVNKSNYENYIIKNVFPGLVKELKEKGIESKKEVENFKGFIFWVLTPAYENYIQEKFKKTRGVNLNKADIDPSDKFIFPKGIQSGIKYFNEFISGYKSGKVLIPADEIAGQRDFGKYMNIYFSLSNETKILIFKEVYYASYYFNSLNRNISITVKLLDDLKKEMKK